MINLNHNHNPERMESLFSKINYKFKDKNLCIQALTHRSFNSNHNERLEFLGDSLLSMIISKHLYFLFPDINEGILTRFRSKLVRGNTLAELAKKFNLGDYLLLGQGELKSGGHNRLSILEDAFEALVGAIFLDSDFDNLEKIVLAWYKDLFKSLDIKMLKDSKTALQEYLQSKGLELPKYILENISGSPPDQKFFVLVKHDALNLSARASGNSRKIAEQVSAKKLLVEMNIDSKK